MCYQDFPPCPCFTCRGPGSIPGWRTRSHMPELRVSMPQLLRVPWTVRRSNQSILKEINPEYSLEELMLKSKLQYFGHLMQRADSLEKTLMLGKVEGRRKREQQRTRILLLFSHSVMSNSLRPIELQHTRPPCPSPSPKACSNSCPLSQ